MFDEGGDRIGDGKAGRRDAACARTVATGTATASRMMIKGRPRCARRQAPAVARARDRVVAITRR
jgi:hypothetical protein